MTQISDSENRKKLVLLILSAYTSLTIKDVEKLIELTSGITGVSFVNISGYNSDKSDHTEIANFKVNFGISYQKMLEKDSISIDNVDISAIDVDNFNYSSIDTNGMTLENFKKAVKSALPEALAEMKMPKKEKESNDVWLNKGLIFNTNTLRLSIFGQCINKETVVKSEEFKLVKSAPKTIAKKLIGNAMNKKTDSLRRFALDNCLSKISLKGDTIEVC